MPWSAAGWACTYVWMANFCLTNLKNFYSFSHTTPGRKRKFSISCCCWSKRARIMSMLNVISDWGKSIKCLRSLSRLAWSERSDEKKTEWNDNCWTQFFFIRDYDDFLTISSIAIREETAAVSRSVKSFSLHRAHKRTVLFGSDWVMGLSKKI